MKVQCLKTLRDIIDATRIKEHNFMEAQKVRDVKSKDTTEEKAKNKKSNFGQQAKG